MTKQKDMKKDKDENKKARECCVVFGSIPFVVLTRVC
jgi:hypothetical protein